MFLKLTFLFLTGSLCAGCWSCSTGGSFPATIRNAAGSTPAFWLGRMCRCMGSACVSSICWRGLPLPGPQAVTVLLQLLIITVALTGIELLAGLLAEWIGHVRLWDYSDRWGNYRG